MDWECAFLYNLSNNIPGRWSLKRPLKMVAIFCVNTVQDVSKLCCVLYCPAVPVVLCLVLAVHSLYLGRHLSCAIMQ